MCVCVCGLFLFSSSESLPQSIFIREKIVLICMRIWHVLERLLVSHTHDSLTKLRAIL